MSTLICHSPTFQTSAQRAGALALAALLLLAGLFSPIAAVERAAAAEIGATEAIEGPFGKVVVNLDHPQLEELWLREPGGGLSKYSVLATEREPLQTGAGWGIPGDGEHNVDGGYSYVVENNGTDGHVEDPNVRYESRKSTGHQVVVRRDSSNRVIAIEFQGVKLTNAAGAEAVREDWVLRVGGEGELVWQIVQRWQRDMTVELSGTPALFLRPMGGVGGWLAGKVPNITSNVWHEPDRLTGESHYLYELPDRAFATAFALAKNTTQTFKDRDQWAVYKLFTNFGLKADIRLASGAEGHLYRRGGQWAMYNEIGAQGAGALDFTRTGGDVTRIDLTVAPIDKYATGHQLQVDIPDDVVEESMRDMYGSLLNGGLLSDNYLFDFGNQSEGVQYGGAAGWRATALAAGVPAAGATSSRPLDAARAFRGHLEHILDTVGPDGLSRYGYNGATWQGLMLDDNLNTVAANRSYYLYSGDLTFVEKYLPTLERMVNFYTLQIDAKDGLFRSPPGSHWYYDLTRYSGYNTYLNVLLFKALQDLADLEEAAGQSIKAGSYRAVAIELKDNINQVLWNEDAPGGPRYSDWIEAGTDAPVPAARKEYFIDMVQWPAIALGVASPEQARKIIATADARLAQLKLGLGYRGNCTLSSLWPQAPTDNLQSTTFYFGRYTNGGCLVANTYWEVMARARAGDASGAYERLSRFAQTYHKMAWVGNNAATIEGEMSNTDTSHGSAEPYLSDMVVVPAALINGVLGITPTLDGLKVTPHLPPAWSQACAQVVYMGVTQKVTIKDGKVTVGPSSGPCAKMKFVNADLRITAIETVQNTGSGGQNGQPKAGDKVVVKATVTNAGGEAAEASVTSFSLDGQPMAGSPVDTAAIPAGESVVVTVTWDTRGLKGDHTIAVTADANDAVAETSETNNVSTLEVSVEGNKVKNGDFSQPNSDGSGPEGWTESDTHAGDATWSDQGTDGSKAATTEGNGGSAVLAGSPSWTSDPISVAPGEVLDLRVSAAAQDPSSVATIGVAYLGAAGELLGSVQVISVPSLTSGFQVLEQQITVPAGVTGIRIILSGFSPTDTHTAGTVTFDDVGLYSQ